MRIASAGSAFPDFCYPQEVLTEALRRHWGPRLERPGLLERVHSRVGVERRHISFPIEKYAQFDTWGESNRAWLEVAGDLGRKAIDAALERAGLARGDIDALFAISVTGIASPSLDARLINQMGLRADIRRTPIFGLGCVGGAVGITRAADYVKAYPKQAAVLLAVELCSLTIQKDDVSPVNLISTGLFSDGAAAVVITGSQRRLDGPEIVSSRSVFYPGTEDIMGWDISERGFTIVLSPRLPDLIRRRLAGDLDTFLAEHELSRRDIGSWVMHPGGPKVLEAVEEALELRDGQLAVSWECLARFGNFSSGSVLRVLEEVMLNRRPAPGTPGVIMAMGPGFCSEMILVRW
jgi:alkylresorcinol/alkylpyrone synthase